METPDQEQPNPKRPRLDEIDQQEFTCSECTYSTKKPADLRRHRSTRHSEGGKVYSCPKCDYKSFRKDNFNRHVKKHAKSNDDNIAVPTERSESLMEVLAESSSQTNHKKQPTVHFCNQCSYTSDRLSNLARHKRLVHEQKKPRPMVPADRLHNVPSQNAAIASDAKHKAKKQKRCAEVECSFSDPMLPTEQILNNVRPDIRELVSHWWPQIRSRQRNFRFNNQYTLRLDRTDREHIADLLECVHREQTTQYKVNLAFGFILQHKTTKNLSFYHPSNNTHIREVPMLIQNGEDLQEFLSVIEDMDILEYAKKLRPNSEYVPIAVVNMVATIYPIRNSPIGNGEVILPEYIMRNPAINALVKDKNHSFPYTDKLCLFRSLALHQGANISNLQKPTRALFLQYCRTTNVDPSKFRGITFDELHLFELVFGIPIHVYSIDKDHNATLERRSIIKHEKPMYLNVCEDHYSYINDFSTYAKAHKCRACDSVFSRRCDCHRHEKVCPGVTKLVFPGGVYTPSRSVFEDLALLGFELENNEDVFYPYRCAFDIECMLKKNESLKDSDSTTWQNVHEIMSVSSCSTIPGFKHPEFMVSNGDPKELAKRLVDYLEKMSDKATSILTDKYSDILSRLDELIETQQQELSKYRQETIMETEDDENLVNEKPNRRKRTPPALKIKIRLLKWIAQLPVFGFNSGRYDLNAMKSAFFPALLDSQRLGFVVKKQNNYMCITTEKLRLMDISNFLAPGTSYTKFLKAFKVKEQKGHFPYEYMDSLDRLKDTVFPSKEAFYNKLRGEAISQEDYDYCKQVFEKMDTMEDFLRWYNDKDTVPFLAALEEMSKYFQARGLDLAKDGISIPGLALKDLFANIDTFFSLVRPEDADLFHLMKSNIVGGPSLQFTRYHMKGETYIRKDEFGEEAKLCGGIFGFDGNGLYLGCTMMPMPSGYYTRRFRERGFRAETSHKYGAMANEWLTWSEHKYGHSIIHKHRNGKEFTVGARAIPVDGYIKKEKKVLQFQGCLFHGHGCHLTIDYKTKQQLVTNPINDKPMDELRANTEEISQYIRDNGFELEEIWECQWRYMKNADEDVKHFIEKEFSSWTSKHTGPTSEENIKSAIKSGQLFGLVQCDIHVPDDQKHIWAEMPPIFKNTEVSRDDIGDFMKSYAEEHDLLTKPRRMLIGSMFGKKILLATPLLKYYMEEGLVVTHIYQIVEFIPKSCFKSVGERVCQARRDGDADPDKAIIAEMEKLMGNSFYGKTATNQLNFTDVQYFNAHTQAKEINRAISHHSFRSLEEIGDDYVEVIKAPKTTKLNLPLQIAFFVYQYAKLRMLQFYKNFMLVHFDRRDFSYLNMDTDSAYIAFSSDNWLSLIKDKAKFEAEKDLWFPRTSPPEAAAYDRRTPMLFKEEWSGSGFVGLCSKTYYCLGNDDTETYTEATDKYSCKGLQKKLNKFTFENYRDVLLNRKSGGGTNKGFRTIHSAVYSYEQDRNGLSYFYPKRKVLADGVSTTYLDI